MKKILLSVMCLSMHAVNAQRVGIGTINPDATLHVDPLRDNSSASVTKNQDDVVVNSAGNLGVGNNNPATRVDIRSGQNLNAIGIGYSNKSAAGAGAGAIRYNPTNNFIEYSDGTNWILLSKRNQNDFVSANNPTSARIANGTSQIITNWTEKTDINETFDPASGIFTAQYPGIYVVAVNIGFLAGRINSNSDFEIRITSNNSTGIPQYKCLFSYPGKNSSPTNNISSGSCTGIFNLNAGERIDIQALNNFGAARTIDPSATQLTIFGL